MMNNYEMAVNSAEKTAVTMASCAERPESLMEMARSNVDLSAEINSRIAALARIMFNDDLNSYCPPKCDSLIETTVAARDINSASNEWLRGLLNRLEG